MSDLGVSLTFNLVDRLTGGMRNIQASVGRASGAFTQASRAVKQTEENMARLSTSMENLQRRMQLAQNFAIVGGQVSRVGNQMLRPIDKAIDVAANFEERMSKVGAVTQATADEMASMTRQARDLGSSTQFSASQAAEGMVFLGMAGFRTNEILASMPGMLAAAKAGSMDLARTADIASNILSGFGLEADQMGRVADVLVATFTSSNASTEQLGETMKYVAPLARAAGMSLEQAAAMAGLLGNAGIQGSMAGTTLRGMLMKLTSPASDAVNLLDQFNIELLDFDGNLRSPVMILGELAEAMEGMGTGEKLKALSTIFDDRAASGMAKLMEDEGVGGITKFIDALNQADGAAQRVATQMGDNARGSIIEFRSATEGLQIAFANLLLPTVRMATGLFTQMTRGLAALTEQHPRLAKVIGLTVGGLGILAVTMGGLLALVSAILGPFAMLSHAMLVAQIQGVSLSAGFRAMGVSMLGMARTGISAVIGGLTKMAVFMLTNPIGLTITAIAVAAFLIIKYWTPISGFFVRLWGGIKSGALQLWEGIKRVFGFSPLGMIMKNWEPIVKFFEGVWDKIGGIFERIGGWFGRRARPMTAGAMAGVSTMASPTAAPAAISTIPPIERTIEQAQVNRASSTINAPIAIHAAPGQSEAEIARQVVRELDNRQRAQAARRRSRLYD